MSGYNDFVCLNAVRMILQGKSVTVVSPSAAASKKIENRIKELLRKATQ